MSTRGSFLKSGAASVVVAAAVGLISTPMAHGAVGDGETLDMVAVNKWLQFGRDNDVLLELDLNKRYLVDDTVVIGTATCDEGIRGINGNESFFVGAVNGKSIVSFAGIQNGLRPEFTNIKVEPAEGFIPRSGFFSGRPKQAGVDVFKSSGNAHIRKNYAYGEYLVSGYENISSESNVVSGNFFANTNGWAEVWSSCDLFVDTCKLEYAGNLVLGSDVVADNGTFRVLTIGEGTAAGWAWVKLLNGTLVQGDNFNGGSVVNNPIIIPRACQEFPLGVEENSTSALQHISDNWIQNRGNSLFGTVLVNGFTDIKFNSNNNNNAIDGDHLWIMAETNDFDVNAQRRGISVEIDDEYYHAQHRDSIRIGSPIGTPTDVWLNATTLYAGKEDNRLNILPNCRLRSGEIAIDGSVKCSGEIREDVTIRLKASQNAVFDCSGIFSGVVHVNDKVVVNIPDNSFGDVHNGSLSKYGKAALGIVNNEIFIKKRHNRIYGTNKNVIAEVQNIKFASFEGDEFKLSLVSDNYPVTFKQGGAASNIRTRSGNDYVLTKAPIDCENVGGLVWIMD